MGSNTVTYCERCGRYRVAETAEATLDERTKERDAALEWRAALDELHVTNWIGVIDGLSPREAVRKLLELALDQERDRLREERDEAIARWNRVNDKYNTLLHRPGTGTARAEQAEAALARVREALRNLVAKLGAIEPHVSNVCAIAQIHGVPYTGPNWADEIAAARAALTPAAPEPPKGDPR